MMTENISDFFPGLQATAGELYGVMTPIAAVLAMIGLIVKIGRSGSDPASLLRTIMAVGFVAVAIAFFPEFGNLMQEFAHAIVSKLEASPAEVHERFARIIAGSTADSNEKVGLWDVLFSKKGGIGHAIFYVAVLFVAKLALVIMWLIFIIQQVLVLFQIGLAPIFLAMFLIGPLNNIAVQFQMRFVAVLLWPLGFGIANLMTDALLDLAAKNLIYEIAGGITIGGPQLLFFIMVISIWVLISTIAAPFLIWKLLSSGANVGASLLSSVGMALSQGALYGVSGGATAGMLGASGGVTSGAAAIGGASGAISGAMGSNGSLIPSAIGVGAAVAVNRSMETGPVDYNAKASEIAQKGRS